MKKRKLKKWRKRARVRSVKRKQPRTQRPAEALPEPAPSTEAPFEYRVPEGTWSLGGRRFYSREHLEWWRVHEVPIRAWLDELESDPEAWVQSAQHAAYCLVSYACRDMGSDLKERDELYSWADFDTNELLFIYLSEGGTVGMCGPVDVFFDDLVEAMRRMSGVVDAQVCARVIEEMQPAREDFIRFYSGEESEEVLRAIAQPYREHIWPQATRRRA